MRFWQLAIDSYKMIGAFVSKTGVLYLFTRQFSGSSPYESNQHNFRMVHACISCDWSTFRGMTLAFSHLPNSSGIVDTFLRRSILSTSADTSDQPVPCLSYKGCVLCAYNVHLDGNDAIAALILSLSTKFHSGQVSTPEYYTWPQSSMLMVVT